MAAAAEDPIPGPEAFEVNSRDARLSQAAYVLAIGAAVGSEPERLRDLGLVSEDFPIPDPARLSHPEPIPLRDAAEPLDIPAGDYGEGYPEQIAADECRRLAREVQDAPEPTTAAALVEAALHSRYKLVRTAAAAAALGTTGRRPDVVKELETSLRASDPDISGIARTALARIEPDDPSLLTLATRRPSITARTERSETAVLTHGTFATRRQWWRPGGSFYTYLDGLRPPLHMHDESYRWSGAYSHAARDLAAGDLVDWVSAQQLTRPDFLAHSHGATVANLATTKGQDFRRLVLMALPVHEEWLPELGQVDAVLDVRVRFDLVILADLGGQRLPSAMRSDPKVTEERNGWFSHSSVRTGEYWEEHGLPDVLAGL